MLRYLLLVIAVIAVLVSVLLYSADRRWRTQSSLAHRTIFSGVEREPEAHLYVSFDELVGLPEPVLRYFRYAVPERTALARTATVTHEGDFAIKPGQWSRFRSTQLFRVRPPAFVWDARIDMFPGIRVRVRDSYVDEYGAMRASVAGLLNVADVQGTPEIASGALARLLAEAVWIPTALLPRPGLEWTSVNDSTAKAELTDGKNSVSVEFHFAQDGRIVGISGERFRDVNGKGVLTPWRGSFADYTRLNDVMIPMAGEVAWVLTDGVQPYWRGRVLTIRYD